MVQSIINLPVNNRYGFCKVTTRYKYLSGSKRICVGSHCRVDGRASGVREGRPVREARVRQINQKNLNKRVSSQGRLK